MSHSKIGNNFERHYHQWLLILLIVSIFYQTYHRSWVNTQKSSPYIVNYAPAAGIAISELKYGSQAGIGYMKIYNLFNPVVRWGVDWGPEFSIVNKVINEALNLDNVAEDGLYYTNYEGLSTFYKLAFLIFDYRAESAFYLYWSLLSLSTLVFLVTFYPRQNLLFYLLLFNCALFAVSQTQGVLLESIIRNRYFPIVTVLPSIYLILLISGIRGRDWITLIGAVSQTAILILIIYVRPSTLYQLIFLVGTTVILLIFRYWKKRNSNTQSAIQFWPLLIVIIAYALLRLYTLNTTSPGIITNRSCTWHMYYMGLAAHPKAFEKYGIIGSDDYVYDLVTHKAPDEGYNLPVRDAMSSLMVVPVANTQEGLDYCGKIYEEIVRNEFIKLFRQDPWFVVSSYLYKIPEYFWFYFHHLATGFINAVYENPSNVDFSENYVGFGVIDQLADWSIVVTLFLGILLIGRTSLQEWLYPLILFVFQFLCALLIPVIYRPFYNTIVDSALSLTVILLAIFFGSISWGLYLLDRYWTNSKLISSLYISLTLFSSIAILWGILGYQPFKPHFNELPLQETRFYGQPVDQVFPEYEGFHIILYKGKYYALAQLGQVDVTIESTLNDCRVHQQCFVGNSLEEIKLQVSPPKIILENYQTFDIVNFDYRFYILSRKLGLLYKDFEPTVLISDQFLQICQAHGQCAIGNSLEEAKQLVDLMPKLVVKDHQGFDIVSYYYKYYIFSQELNVLDHDLDPAKFAAESFLQECQAHGQCAVGNSLEEAKQLVDLMISRLITENYKGFHIITFEHKFYAISQSLVRSGWRFDPKLLENDFLMQACQQEQKCIIGNSLAEIKQLVHQLIRQTQ